MWNAASICARYGAFAAGLCVLLLSPVTSTGATNGRRDHKPPTAPTSLSVRGSTATSLSLSWSASRDNVGVAGYDVYVDGGRIGKTGQTNYTFTALACGKSYTLGVDAYDSAGNRSAIASVIAAPPCGDNQAPTAPANLALAGRTTSSLSLTWQASTDNVGIAGYDVSEDGTRVGTVYSPGDTLTGLSCGTSYTVSVDAYDAAGNRSAKTTAPFATSACSIVQAPSPSPSPSPSTAPSLLLKADAEGPVASEFGQIDDGPHCQSAPVEDANIHKSSFHVQGSYSWEFEHFPTDADCYGRRSEAVLGDSLGVHKFNEGDDVWEAFQVYLPSALNGTDYTYWISTTQTSKASCGGSPRGQLTQSGGKWMFMEGEKSEYIADLGSTGSIFLTDTPIVSDRWVKFAIHTYYNVDNTKGFVELYGDIQDGRGFRLLMPKRYGATNGYCSDGVTIAHPMVRLGLYAHTSFPNIHFVEYIDGMTVSDSRDAAEQNAFGYVP